MDQPIDVSVLLLDGGHASTALGPLEIFQDARALYGILTGGDATPRFRVRTVSADGGAIRPGTPVTLRPDCALADVERTDLVFVPSAGLGIDAILERNAPVIAFLQRAAGEGARVAGVCSGVSLLAAAGLLDGRRGTTHWALADEFAVRFPQVRWEPGSIVTESDGIYCGGGVYAAFDLALYLVERLCGREVAIETSKSLLIDMPRICQTGFAVLPLSAEHADEDVRRAEEWIHGHCREDVRFDALARELGMSPRNFMRRFKAATGLAPLEYLQRLRITAARRLLEQGEIRIQDVGAAVGYEDLAFFRQLFKRHTGLSPQAYRARFAP